MAGKSTISITFKMDGDSKGFKELAKDADGLKTIIRSTLFEAEKLSTGAINFAALATGIDAAQRSFTQLQAGIKDLSDAYGEDEIAAKKLATVMEQRMNASAADIQAIKDLASAQQELGVIGDEVQLSGAQQVATFLNEKASLETLLPAMNNLLAQQKGLTASTSDAVGIANLMGKVMQGQVSSLKKVGITFTAAEEKVLKYGTESERAAMLAQVITNNVGQMNAALADTDSGQQKQLEDTLGDVKEKIGGLVNGALPFVTISAQALTAIGSVITLSEGIKTLTTTLYTGAKAFAIATVSMIKNKGVTLAVAAAQKAVAAATVIWTNVQRILNGVLKANPIGLLVTAIGALGGALIYAYNHCEGFRRICHQVWGTIAPLASAIMDGLAYAFEWMAEKCSEAWEWLKRILNLGGKNVEVAVSVTKPNPTLDTDLLEEKYANYTPTPLKSATKQVNPTVATPEAKSSLGLIGQLEDKITAARDRLREATGEAAIVEINQEIAAYEGELDKYEGLGKKVAESVEQGVQDNGPIWKAEAEGLNKEIELWKTKADAIQNAGKEAEHAANASLSKGALVRGAMGDFGDLMKSLSGVVGEGASGWLSYGATVLSSISQALPALASLVGGNIAQAFAGAAAQSQTVPFPFNLISLAASMAAVGAAVASIPKFANGGIVSGPTLAMVGEYAGASGNPEVIAPLNKLRGMLADRGDTTFGGRVEFEIKGRTLVGILNKENNITKRS